MLRHSSFIVHIKAPDSGFDCVLPTAPSLADMFQSDICSSIASAESSVDGAETPSPTTDIPALHARQVCYTNQVQFCKGFVGLAEAMLNLPMHTYV